MEAIRSYRISKKVQNQGYMMAGLMMVLFVAGLLLTGKAIVMFLVFGVLRLSIATLSSNHKVVKVYTKHFEIKQGVATSTKLIKNEDFRTITIENKKIVIEYINTEQKLQTVKLLKVVFEEGDLESFITFLESIKQDSVQTISDAVLQKV